MSFLLEPPEQIEGIGPTRAASLAAGGITTIAEMLAERPPKVLSLLGNVSARQVGDWYCAAVLRRVDGVTPNMAEALVEAGVRTVSSLAEAGLRTVERAVDSARDAGRMTESPSVYELAGLQREAWRVRERGMLTGFVLDAEGRPVEDAVVEVGRYDFDLDDKGRYAFDKLPAGDHEVTITLPDRVRPLLFGRRAIVPGKLVGPVIHRISPSPTEPLPPLRLDELDGHLLTPTASYQPKLVTAPLSEFRDGTHFLVRETSDDSRVKLLSLYRKRRDEVTLIERAKVSKDDVPVNTKVGDVLLLDSGALAKTDMTPAKVATLKRKRWLETRPTRVRHVFEA